MLSHPVSLCIVPAIPSRAYLLLKQAYSPTEGNLQTCAMAHTGQCVGGMFSTSIEAGMLLFSLLPCRVVLASTEVSCAAPQASHIASCCIGHVQAVMQVC